MTERVIQTLLPCPLWGKLMSSCGGGWCWEGERKRQRLSLVSFLVKERRKKEQLWRKRSILMDGWWEGSQLYSLPSRSIVVVSDSAWWTSVALTQRSRHYISLYAASYRDLTLLITVAKTHTCKQTHAQTGHTHTLTLMLPGTGTHSLAHKHTQAH